MQKKIIINNKIYSQTAVLKLLKLSKSHYHTLKENTGFELKHLSDNTLKTLKKELNQSLKLWKQIRIEVRKWLTKFNKKYGSQITTGKLKQAITKHNQLRIRYRSYDTQKLTYANVIKNKSVFNNPDRLFKTRDYFSKRSELFYNNFKIVVNNFIGYNAFLAIEHLTIDEAVDLIMDALDGAYLTELYIMSEDEFFDRVNPFLDYIKWKRENYPETNHNNDIHTFKWWKTNVKDLK